MSTLRYALIAIGAIAVTIFFSSQIKVLENIRQNGQTVLLDLRPNDPRALMLGDFMALRYVEERNSNIPKKKDLAPSGQFVLALDDNKVGTFNRVASGRNLQEGEVLINYIRQRRNVTFGAPRFYFQNGTAQTFEAAEYGIFKINPSGRAILVGLADETFAKIEPPKT